MFVCCTLIDLDRLARTCREAEAAGRVNASEVDEGEQRGQDTGTVGAGGGDNDG